MGENETAEISLAEEIKEFNRKLNQQIEKLNQWRSEMVNMQEEFVEKLKARTLRMKVE